MRTLSTLSVSYDHHRLIWRWSEQSCSILFPSSHRSTVPSTKETTHQSSVSQPISLDNMYLSSRQKVIVAPFLSQSFIKWKNFQYIYQKDKCTNKYKCNQTKMGRVQHYNTLPDYKTGAWVTIDIYKLIKAMFSVKSRSWNWSYEASFCISQHYTTVYTIQIWSKQNMLTGQMPLQLIGCNLAIWKFWLQEAYLVLYTIVWGLNIHTFCVWKPTEELIKI